MNQVQLPPLGNDRTLKEAKKMEFKYHWGVEARADDTGSALDS